MKSLLVVISFFGFGISLCSDALACSCAAPQSVETALREATVVVIAELVSAEQHATADGATSAYITEDAKFRVLETLKGNSRVGDVLDVRSTFGSGSCGISVKNSPVWLETLKNAKATAPPLSGRWLIYGEGKPPFALDRCSHSKPMEYGGEQESRRLRSLARHDKKEGRAERTSEKRAEQ